MDFQKSETKINLMRAFAGESMARSRYYFASELANTQKMYFIHQIFKFTAHQESQHAQVFYDFLKQAGTGEQEITAGYPFSNYETLPDLLKEAEENEYKEFNEIYPAFAKTAKEEGFKLVSAAFDQIAKIEQTHGDRFSAFHQLLSNKGMFSSDTETAWLCLNCGHIHYGKKAPKSCAVCSYAQGYFVPEKYYDFIADEYTKA